MSKPLGLNNLEVIGSVKIRIKMKFGSANCKFIFSLLDRPIILLFPVVNTMCWALCLWLDLKYFGIECW